METIEIPVPVPTTLPDALPQWPAFPIGWLPVEGGPEDLVCYEPETDAAGTRWIERVMEWRDTALRFFEALTP